MVKERENLRGRAYWRSLQELAADEEFLRFVRAEFPGPADLLDGEVSRREFLKLMGASLALAGLGACTRQPKESIYPYTQQPEHVVPGEPSYYATAFELGGAALGILAESHMGRPTKIEGNPEHPASLGATDVFAQASVLDLYDPDRGQVVTRAGEITPWSDFVTGMDAMMQRHQGAKPGQGLRLLTPAVVSPTLAGQLEAFRERYPHARWHRYEPVHRDNARVASELAFGTMLDMRFDLSRADVIVSIDAEILAWGAGGVRYARDFSERRRLEGERREMNRLYAVESTPTITGAKADHRLAAPPSEVGKLALRLATLLGMEVASVPLPDDHEHWIAAARDDLLRHRGRSLVVAGDAQPPFVHAVIHWINRSLGNVGTTIEYIDALETDPVLHGESIRELVHDAAAGKVQSLVIIGGNPAYDAPAELDFPGAVAKVATIVRLGLYDDETSRLAHWYVPQTHPLETWTDTRTYDGTVTICQPLILPLYDGKSAHELISVLLGETGRDAHDIVQAHWRKTLGERDFETLWRKSVHDGVVEGTRSKARKASLRPDLGERIDREVSGRERGSESGIVEVLIRPDPHVYDGRFANNGWLQELPKPITKLTWDNAVLLGPRLAEELAVADGDLIEIESDGRTVEGGAWIVPGHADRCVTIHLGYGRRHAGKVGSGLGFDAYRLRTVDGAWLLTGGRVRKTGGRIALAATQHHHSMEGRGLVRSATLERYRSNPAFAHEHHDPSHERLSLYPDHPYEGHAWGLTVDLNACIGCNACTIACQAENNIAVVGKQQVLAGREMHWIRVDRYFEGDPVAPHVHHQPVLCMHCEKAPCEVVCPVNATVHSDEGLNDMVYNRCVGTRYCSNNCPYKVRRFNFFLYSDWETETFKMQRNPDVTVRSRGVMEKCTYCVQRINEARIRAKKEGRSIADGEIVTACQQACPADAIAFGDVNDPGARVSRLKREPRNYSLLGELGTRPRTTYLASVRNPNDELSTGDDDHGGEGGHG